MSAVLEVRGGGCPARHVVARARAAGRPTDWHDRSAEDCTVVLPAAPDAVGHGVHVAAGTAHARASDEVLRLVTELAEPAPLARFTVLLNGADACTGGDGPIDACRLSSAAGDATRIALDLPHSRCHLVVVVLVGSRRLVEDDRLLRPPAYVRADTGRLEQYFEDIGEGLAQASRPVLMDSTSSEDGLVLVVAYGEQYLASQVLDRVVGA